MTRNGLFRISGARIALAAATLAVLGASSRGTSDPLRFDGEYGLYVRLTEDSAHVGWITAPAQRGWLRAEQKGQPVHEAGTTADSAHAVAFRYRADLPLVLHYGSADDTTARHTTRIDPPPRRRPDVSVRAADSLFVLGDTHGEFDTMTAVLRNAGVIDDALHWKAGRAHLAVLGDVTDRGADVTRALWFLYRLEREAAEAGGRVHLVIGNHELMVMLDDLRYVGRKELDVARLHGVTYDRMFDPRHTVLGRWLVSKPGLIRIGDVLLAHGGVSTDYLPWTVETVDDTLAAYVQEDLFYHWADTTFVAPLDSAGLERRIAFFWSPNSIFWYRGFAQADTLGDELDAVLRRYRSSILVVGHTPGGTVRQSYDGRLIMTNTVPFGAEVLLLTRTRDGWQRERRGTSGAAQAVEDATTAATVGR